MEDREGQYRKQAKEAQRQADAAKNESDKSSWLQIAQGWLSMLPRRKPTAKETFEAKSDAQGTKQDKSDSSH
jgi:uncharacterized phage infection (PIP) family protein YhgE